MALAAGVKLGPYEILTALGAGGMGEVYRAIDTRLRRTVAIKILLEHLGSDPDRRARFEREARAASSLNHPNICTVFDIGEQDGIHYIVMEYLEGETLEQRLERGPLSIEQAVQIATQVADALDKAHRQGLVHRDLKPGNVMLSKPAAKLLDFGLAKLKREEHQVSTFSGMPTLGASRALTAEGTILGTLQYMAPEQLEGKEADSRTDIFAFGAMVYEMVTGKKAFQGKSQASLISAIMSAEPDSMSTLQPSAPPVLDRIVKRCLAKDPENRWQSARDLVLELQASPSEMTPRIHTIKDRLSFVGIAAAVIVLTLVLTSLLSLRTRSVADNPGAELVPIRFTVSPPEGTGIHASYSVPFAISPDGRQIVFVGLAANGQRQLWLRPLDSELARPISGTGAATSPFWSPDSQWIGFVAEESLKKIPISGGAPQTIAALPTNDVGDISGAGWNADGVIIFSAGVESGLYRVSAQGGPVSPATTLNAAQGEFWHMWPQFLNDGRHFIYAALTGDRNGIYLASLDGGEPRLLMDREFNASTLGYKAGYILFVQDAALFARPFDEGRLQFSGEPLRILDGVPVSGAGRAPFAVSSSGVLAYSSSLIGDPSVLKWFRRDGAATDVITVPAFYSGFTLAPDNSRLVFSRFDAKGARDIWLRDLLRGSESKLSFDGDSMDPVWAPDGSRIAFASARGNPPNLFIRAVNGGEDERRTNAPTQHFPTSWSADGSFIVYEVVASGTKTDLWLLRLQDSTQEALALNTPFNESAGKISPNGMWLAYVSDQSGRNEVWIASFPSGRILRQVSVDGGEAPEWRGDGRELFYVSAQRDLMAVSINPRNSDVDLNVPTRLFSIGSTDYSASLDGRQFLVAVNAPQSPPPPIHIVINWNALLERR